MKTGVLLALVVFVAGALSLEERSAHASVAVSALFEELVRGASAAAVVTPLDQQGVWEDGVIATYTHVRVGRLMGGTLPGEIRIRALGGAVGDIGQLVEGEARFAIGRPSLLFLRPHVDAAHPPATSSFVVVERAQGQFPVTTSADGTSRLALAADLGALIAPPPERTTRAAQGPTSGGTRLARDVLERRSLEDAAREIAAAWPRTHGATASPNGR